MWLEVLFIACVLFRLLRAQFGCLSSAIQEHGPQRRARNIVNRLLKIVTPSEDASELPELVALFHEVMQDSEPGSHLVAIPSAATLESLGGSTPCIPSIVFAHWMQILWLWRVNNNAPEALVFFISFSRQMAWLRTNAWHDLVSIGYGTLFAVADAICELVPANPDGKEVDARTHHWDWPYSLAFANSVFQQYHMILGFDYRDCVSRFLGSRETRAPSACNGPSKASLCDKRVVKHSVASQGALWPHLQFTSLAARQPSACGIACRYAAAFSFLAQALILRRSARSSRERMLRHRSENLVLSEDERELLKAAQAEIAVAEATFWGMEAAKSLEESCSLTRAFPIWTLLARLDCFPGTSPVRKHDDFNSDKSKPDSFAVGGRPGHIPVPDFAKHCDWITGWPPLQGLTRAGSLALYYLLDAVGSLLDAFGVVWWASSGTLLGAVRNGGIMPQDCDVDLAVWKPNASHLVTPQFRSALLAKGIASYHLPIYFEFRACLVQVPAAASIQSADGKLACLMPYIDIHLVDKAEFPNRYSYIHRTDLRYAGHFPLSGVFNVGADGVQVDVRRRIHFGEHTYIWVPQPRETEEYLNIIYGDTWRVTLRDRYGALVYNDTGRDGSAFIGQIAKPTGPFDNIFSKLHSLDLLDPSLPLPTPWIPSDES